MSKKKGCEVCPICSKPAISRSHIRGDRIAGSFTRELECENRHTWLNIFCPTKAVNGFRNALEDLRDCKENLDLNDALSEEEKRARIELIKLCVGIARDFGDEVTGGDE